MTRAISAAMAVLCACGGGEDGPATDPPGCAEAAAIFYGAGCEFQDAAGEPFTEAGFAAQCSMLQAAVPPNCEDELDTFLICIGETPMNARDNVECLACSREFDLVLRCDP